MSNDPTREVPVVPVIYRPREPDPQPPPEWSIDKTNLSMFLSVLALLIGIFSLVALLVAPSVLSKEGPRGPQGVPGVEGIQGVPGLKGDIGPMGPKGDPGEVVVVPDTTTTTTPLFPPENFRD